MAKAKKVAKAINGKPKTKLAVPDTREGLILDMGKLLDQVDQLLPTLENVYWNYPTGKLQAPRDAVNNLIGRMSKLLGPDDDMAEAILETATSAELGTVPSLARAGRFVEWVGYVPVLFEWGGFISREACFRMVDPAEKFINSTGYQSLQCGLPLAGTTVRDLARLLLTQRTRAKDFALLDVGGQGRDETIERLAANEWLRKVIERGPPADAIPLPPKLQAVQKQLFI